MIFFEQKIKSFAQKMGYQIVSTYRYGVNPIVDINRVLEDRKLSGHLTFRKNGTIFDVGANNGQSSVKFLETYPDANIYAFEPVETTFKELTSHTSHYPNVHCYQIALGDKVGNKEIYVYPSSVLSSLIDVSPLNLPVSMSQSVTIEIDTIDRFCSEHKIESIDLLKVDTEGFDLNVLQGAEGLLRQKAVNFIYFEFFRIGQDNDSTSGGRLIDLHNYLINFGMRPVAFYTDFVHHDLTIGVYNGLYMKWK